MRITISLTSDKEIRLPVHYNHILQGFLYNNLSDKGYKKFLHDQGYKYNNRQFRLFTFSRLNGKFQLLKEAGQIMFFSPVHIVVASPIEQFITDVAETLIKSDFNFLGSNLVNIESIAVHQTLEFTDKVHIKMLSPVVTYQTDTDGKRKKTNYFSPWDEPFQELVNQNLYKKYQIINGEKPNGEIKVIPVGYGKEKFASIINYKNFYIKGYAGLYWLTGNPDLIKVAYDTGLGSKNSQGFGCWEVVN